MHPREEHAGSIFPSRAAVATTAAALIACACEPGAGPDASMMDDAALDAVELDAGTDAPVDAERVYPPFCDPPTPPPEVLVPMGDATTSVRPDGRALTPAGPQVELGGFPLLVRVHPDLPIAYVLNAGYGGRSVQVVDLGTRAIIQQIDRPELFHGLTLSRDASTLFVSGGDSQLVEAYDVEADGRLTARAQIEVGGYPAGLAASADGRHLWAARFHAAAPATNGIVELDASTLAIGRVLELPWGAYQLAELPARNELWVTSFAGTTVGVIALASFTLEAEIEVGSGPVELAVAADGATVWTSVSDADEVVAIDVSTRTVRARRRVAEGEGLDDADGMPLHASSTTGLTLDPGAGRLYVTRAADDAVSVLDAASLEVLGSIPVGWYPSAVALAGTTLISLDAKGVGVGPVLDYEGGDESGKERMTGTLTLVELAGLDLAAQTAQFRENVGRPASWSWDCDGTFPVPSHPGRPTPIEHIVLIVRENKTYDCLFGDLGVPDAAGDPSLVLYGDELTPNLHALARSFANHDNFYNDGETSVQGHFWLTSSFVNDYMERTWLEDYRGNPGWGRDPVSAPAIPDSGSFFEHLLRHGIDFDIYGEVVSSTGRVGDELVSSHIDSRFPGLFFNTSVHDEEKARYVADRMARRGLPPFTYLLLPNDHSNGLAPGELTPESMIADNDLGTGIVVDAITRLPEWEHTAIFIVQDDTQAGSDHVDYHRSILVVISPWARRGHTSHVHTSFPSLFRTFELILGIPPMHRIDATATPLWDAFGSTMDLAPYAEIPRRVPETRNPGSGRMADLSRRLAEVGAFSRPDRNPFLGAMLEAHARGEELSPEVVERIERWLAAAEDGDRSIDEEAREDVDRAIDEDVREAALYDREHEAFMRWLADHPEIETDIRE
jgi:YVTN family beta-propeller protein